MNATELVEKISGRTGISVGDAAKVVKTAMEIIGDEMARGEKVALANFGVFGVTAKAERSGHNPRTGEPITIPAHKSPTFKAYTALKEKVNR